MIRRVDSLVTPIETILFDVFNKGYLANWMAVMQKFEESVQLIEDDTKNFIDQSFDQLRSAEGAFDLLCNFKDIQSREAINRQMEQKFTNVLDRYSDEVCRGTSALILNNTTSTLNSHSYSHPYTLFTVYIDRST